MHAASLRLPYWHEQTWRETSCVNKELPEAETVDLPLAELPCML